MSRTPRQVLAEVEGWSEATVRPLDGGLTNRNWLVEAGDRRAVLKIDAAPRTLPFNSREAEAQLQSRAAKAGLANAVIYSADTVLMTEYAAGHVWAARDLTVPASLDALARALRSLHALPLTGRRFDAAAAARDYAKTIDSRDARKARQCVERIESVPLPPVLRCCHNDLVAENIIATPALRFLDWEYACDNDPLFDLATVIAHHRLADKLADRLLETYFDGEVSRRREQLQRQIDVYDALLWLWQRARG